MADDMDDFDAEEFQASVVRLSRDLVAAAATMSEAEARYLVDAYYIHQEGRKRLGNQMGSMGDEPHQLISWQWAQSKTMEDQIKRALEIYSEQKLIGRWLTAHYGIGPVIASGLMAHIDIHKAKTAGAIWRFGGMDPTSKWERGEKRPWNAGLKTLFWKVGQSFMKFSGRPACVYGHEYVRRKRMEVARNEKGFNAERAAQILTEKNFKKTTEAYKAYSIGKLPPAHVDAQARRYAVKIFISHVHYVWRFIELKKVPRDPYAIGKMDHQTFIPPQNIDMIPGLAKAMRKAGHI